MLYYIQLIFYYLAMKNISLRNVAVLVFVGVYTFVLTMGLLKLSGLI